MKDGKAERTCFSALPTPNFELLTSRLLSPLDLKGCQPDSVIVPDEQKQDTSNATTTHQSVLSTGMDKVCGAISRDIQRKNRPTESSNQHTSDCIVKKTEGVAAAVHPSHVTQAQQKQVKVNSAIVISNQHATAVKVDTNTQKTLQASKSSDKQKPQVQSSHKRTWNEAIGDDDDDEFDKLCNMVDLSFDADAVSDQVTKVTTPDNSWSDGQNFHHTTGTAIGSTRRQTWTCPMCNEQFEGRLVRSK